MENNFEYQDSNVPIKSITGGFWTTLILYIDS